jgi:hypothetical protein
MQQELKAHLDKGSTLWNEGILLPGGGKLRKHEGMGVIIELYRFWHD